MVYFSLVCLVYRFFKAEIHGQYSDFCHFRSEIENLTDKVRALEVAQVNQRKQQAIAMAALAAEKLKSQKMTHEFQSDSNLAYYNSNSNSNSRENLDLSKKTVNNSENCRQQRLALPMGKRLLLKVRIYI